MPWAQISNTKFVFPRATWSVLPRCSLIVHSKMYGTSLRAARAGEPGKPRPLYALDVGWKECTRWYELVRLRQALGRALEGSSLEIVLSNTFLRQRAWVVPLYIYSYSYRVRNSPMVYHISCLFFGMLYFNLVDRPNFICTNVKQISALLFLFPE
jgi:hypothetical protein